jgi:hypothetical protein
MAGTNDYWIDIKPPPGAYGSMRDLDIVAGGKHHHHHRSGGGFPVFYTDYGMAPVIVSQDDEEIPDNVGWPGFIDNIVHAVVHAGGDVIHAANNAACYAGRQVSKVVSKVEHLPIVGKPLRAVIHLNPLVAIGGLVAKVAKGERIDKALLSSMKGQIASVRDVAPYVQMVASFVPGVGSGLAAAMAAGVALSEGRTITDAVIDGLKKAVPGGAIGQIAMQTALDVAKGNSITTAAMNEAIAQLPAEARNAANIAIAAAKGQNVRVAVLNAIRDHLPADAKKALDIGTAVATARNIQSHVINQLLKPAGLAEIAKLPVPAVFQKMVPKDAGQATAFRTAMGLLQHSGVTAHAIAAVRAKLPKVHQPGFDHALKVYVNHFAPHHTSLVRGGVVSRGAWRLAKKGEKGVTGRLVQNGKVTHGSFVRT